MLINGRGEVWVGQRRPRWIPADADPIWQMPQGGILPGEAPLAAAFRELKEETGVVSVEVLAELPEWLTYRLPPHLLGVALKRRYAGQRQRWFAMRFLGDDSEITLIPQNGGKAEFSAWRWSPLYELPGLALPFKRPIYEAVIHGFADLTH